MITRTHTVEDQAFSYHVATAKARDLLREHSMRSWNRAVSPETMYSIEPEIPTVALGQVTRRLEREGIVWDPLEGTLSVAVELEADTTDPTLSLSYNPDTHTYQAASTKAVTTLDELDTHLANRFRETLDHVAFYMAGSLTATANATATAT